MLLTLSGYFYFPGHTYLQSDTQIYVPIFEHLRDPGLFAREMIAVRPHVGLTIYDDVALLLRRLTGLDFALILQAQQLLFRLVGVWGAFLIAAACGLARVPSLLVAGLIGLGATINGPAVLTFEYEPVPRGYAVLLLLAAWGLALWQRPQASAALGTLAALYQAPMALPFWALYAPYLLWTRRWRALAWPVAGLALLVALTQLSPSGNEHPVFTVLDAEWERLQRLRAAYNWLSLWRPEFFWSYALQAVVVAAAAWRLRAVETLVERLLLLGLPAFGLLSLPFSYLTMERAKWALMAQVQPARAVLFLTLAVTVWSVWAASREPFARAALWLVPAFMIPVYTGLWPDAAWPKAITVAGGALLGAAVLQRRWTWAVPVLMVLASVATVEWAGVRNYPPLHHAELDDVAVWARANTPRDAVFLFPKAGRDLSQGVFRVRAQRALYVDWKGGGQVNYFRGLAVEWWEKWKDVTTGGHAPAYWRSKGVDFLIYPARQAPPGWPVAYANARYAVVALN